MKEKVKEFLDRYLKSRFKNFISTQKLIQEFPGLFEKSLNRIMLELGYKRGRGISGGRRVRGYIGKKKKGIKVPVQCYKYEIGCDWQGYAFVEEGERIEGSYIKAKGKEDIMLRCPECHNYVYRYKGKLVNDKAIHHRTGEPMPPPRNKTERLIWEKKEKRNKGGPFQTSSGDIDLYSNKNPF